jgi:iron complex outermembrane receptor protein
MKKKYLILTSLGAVLCSGFFSSATAGDDPLYSQLFHDSLRETSDIATASRLNVDDMPALVTILYQEDLLKNGVDTIFDALSLVPGVEQSMEATGAKQLIFRGVKEKGKIKLMLDGIDINNTFRGSIYYFYDFPIELVKRIEVIRGPGSELYGSGAMSGVINIVTRIADPLSPSQVFGSIDSDGQYRGGMLYSKQINSWHLAADGYYTKGNKGIDAGPDKGGIYGQSNEEKQDYSVGLAVDNAHLKMTARLKRSQDGIAYGRSYYLESSHDKKGIINKTIFTEIQYDNSFTTGLEYTVRAGYSSYAQELESRVMPVPGGDLLSYVNYKEDKLYADGSLTFGMLDNHVFVGGIRFEDIQEVYDTFRFYHEAAPDILLMPGTATIQPDGARLVTSFYINDQYFFSDALEFSAGLRQDIDSDADNPFSARLGMVYRSSDRLSWKTIYSHSYRVPSWIELYVAVPGPFTAKNDLSSEYSDTVELGTIYKTGLDSRFGFNVYYTWIHDLIDYDPATVSYTQGGENNYVGAELTWKYGFSENTDIDLNLSYVYGTDDDGDKLPDVANWLSNVTLFHTFGIGIVSATRLRMVSRRNRAEGDLRSNLDGYATVDQTLSYRYRDANFILSLKNLFDADVSYPAPADTYVDDYPREGRTVMFKISWDL